MRTPGRVQRCVPGEVRLFDVRIWETAVGDGGTFLVDLTIKGRT